MSSWAISTLRRVAADLGSFEDGRLPHDALDAFVVNLELVYREMLVQEQLDGHPLHSRACTIVRRARMYLATFQDEQTHDCQHRRSLVTYTSRVGRPRFEIPRQQILFLLESGFTGPQIAGIIGASLSTVRRRMAECALD